MKCTLKKNVVAGLLAVTMLFGASPSAYAQTPSIQELQAQIAQLVAMIAQLQAQAGQTNQPSVGFGPYVWTRPLSLGSTGTDVQQLQRFLNTDPDTRVALGGAGSPGNETMYYGPATAAAVSKFQVKYRNEILSPGGLVNPTGFFGPSSLAKANALVASTPSIPTAPTTPTTPPIDDDTDTTIGLRGEGELNIFEIDSAPDDSIEEASADAVIAELTIEARNGDLEISRMDLALVADNGNDERDPWDTFETISLWVDGEKIAEKDIDNRNDYLNRNLGTIRLTNLNLILEEDEEMEVLVAVSVRNNIDGAGTNARWFVSVESIRTFDADRVADTNTTTGDLGDNVSFDIVERGEDEELKFGTGPNNPDATNIVVDINRRTNNQTILEYTIEALDADIELDTLYVNVETGTASFDDVVSDIRLVIGNQTFRKDAVVSTGMYSPTSTRVAFDIDGKVTIDEDEKVRVRVVVDLKARTAYGNGETIKAQIASAERDSTRAEGADDVSKFSGTVIGKVHTLVSEGIVTSADTVKFSVGTQGQNEVIGTFKIEFEVTAIEDDFYIASFASTSAPTSTGGVRYSLDSTVGDPTFISAILSSTADEETQDVFIVREGQSETFTLTVTVDASAPGHHRVALDAIHFSAQNDGVSSVETYFTTPVNKYRTPYQFISN